MTASISPPEAASLREGASALGCTLSDAQADRLLAYVTLLNKWNRVYNLTAIRDRERIMQQHLLDTLAVIAPLTRQVGAARFELLDVGSGAGLPGLVIAAVLGECRVTCVDSAAKKASFVHQAATELGLGNLRSVHARVEQLQAAPFDVVAARAFASLARFVAGTRRLLRPGGVWMAMKGGRPADEIAELPADIQAFHVEPLPGLRADRCLVWMRQRSQPGA